MLTVDVTGLMQLKFTIGPFRKSRDKFGPRVRGFCSSFENILCIDIEIKRKRLVIGPKGHPTYSGRRFEFKTKQKKNDFKLIFCHAQN